MITNKTQIYTRIHCASAKNPKRNPDGFSGSGFLVGDRFVFSCYHVIEAELRSATPAIRICFPHLTGSSFFIDQFTIHHLDKDKDVVVFGLTIPISHVDNPYRLASENCKDLSEAFCEVYYSRSEHVYGLTKGSVADIIHQGLVQVNQADNSMPIAFGHSGAPVWIKRDGQELILGMVRRADGVAVFNFIPGCQLVAALSDYTGAIINKYNLPARPLDYLRNKQDFEKVHDILKDYIHGTAKVYLLVGPTGSGKTTLAIDVAEQLPNKKAWYSCGTNRSLEDYQKTIAPLKSGDLLVIDNLTLEHPLLKDSWLTEKTGFANCMFDILITTQNESLTEALKFQCDFSRRKKHVRKLAGFSGEEANEFFKEFDEQFLPGSIKAKLCRTANGFPMLLKIYKILLKDEVQNRLLSNIDDLYIDEPQDESIYTLNYVSILNKAVERLFSSPAIILGETEKEIMTVLSCFSVVGAMESVILKEMIQGDFEPAVRNLRNIGFVTFIKNPFALLDGSSFKLVLIHDVFRTVLPLISRCDQQRYTDRFFSCLNANRDKQSAHGVVSRMESLIIRMKNLWLDHGSSEKTEVFTQTLTKCCEELSELIPPNCDFTYLSNFIAERFSAVVAKECYIVIPIAVTLTRLPQNDVLAEMIWQGTKNIYYEEYDNKLARACCIFCAFTHWMHSATANKELILDKAKLHLEQTCLMNDHPDELEITVLLSGIMRMGDVNFVRTTVDSQNFELRKYYSAILYLVLMVNAQDQLDSERNSKKRLDLQKFLDWLVSNKLSITMESEAKIDVLEYLRTKRYPLPYNKPCLSKLADEQGISRLVGRTSFCPEFDDLAKRKRGAYTII